MSEEKTALLVDIIGLFSLETELISRFIPDRKERIYYKYISESGEFIVMSNDPLHAMLSMACIFIKRNDFADLPDDDSFGDTYFFMKIILDLGSENPYLYGIDKSKCVVRGPYDGVWNLLRKMAKKFTDSRGGEIKVKDVFLRTLAAIDGSVMKKRSIKRLIVVPR